MMKECLEERCITLFICFVFGFLRHGLYDIVLGIPELAM